MCHQQMHVLKGSKSQPAFWRQVFNALDDEGQTDLHFDEYMGHWIVARLYACSVYFGTTYYRPGDWPILKMVSFGKEFSNFDV